MDRLLIIVLVAAAVLAAAMTSSALIAAEELPYAYLVDSKEMKNNIRSSSSRGSNLSQSNSQVLYLGFENSKEDVATLQFNLKVDPKLIKDYSACASLLPETHTGGCKLKEDGLLFYAFSMTNSRLPSGNLGMITLSTGNTKAVSLTDEVMADVHGVELDDARKYGE